jgi:hypothetical protein
MLRIFYNGIKSTLNDNKLETAYISYGTNGKHEPEIYISTKHYNQFSAEIMKEFTVENHSDSQSDYFEQDHFTITQSSKYWNDFLRAAIINENKTIEKIEKRIANPKTKEYNRHYYRSILPQRKSKIDELNNMYIEITKKEVK